MTSCLVFIILLNFIQIYGLEVANVSDAECPVSWFRRKRAINEYTRWRANIDTTSEFIVKVLDDEVTTSGSNKIVMAVNILPVTKRREKIIIGGAMVPPPTSSPIADIFKDYTRFVPPTTATTPVIDDLFPPVPTPITLKSASIPIKVEVSRINKEVPFFPLNPKGRNVLRDESPPASPQFIARVSPKLPARQYAPIAPVAFTRRTTVTPLTPPIYDRYNSYEIPTRSSAGGINPSRTVPNALPLFRAFLEDRDNENEIFLTRTTTKDVPERTTTTLSPPVVFDEGEDSFQGTSRPYVDLYTKIYNVDINQAADRNHGLEKDMDGKNSDSNYNHMFLYNDDLDITGRKSMEYEETDKHDNDFSDKLIDEINLETTTVVLETHATDEPQTENTTDLPLYSDDKLEITDNASDIIRGIPSKPDEKSRDKRRPVCNMIKLRQLNFNTPRTLPEIVAQLKQWVEESPITRWVDITEGNLTTMENPIYMLIVDDTSVGQVASEKLNAFIIAGIQGRDHHAVAAAMYILFQLIERSENHFDLLSKYRFWIIPVFNPDGYDYSMTFPHKREWMKNMRQSWDICKGKESCSNCDSYGLRCTIAPCYGVNLDRNFEYQWIPTEELRAEHPCGNLFAGSRQLSETETSALSKYLHRLSMPISIFIAFKEGDVLGVMYPHSHVRNKRPFDNIYRQRAGRAAGAAYSIAARPFVAGQTSEFLPLYAGGIEDWADGHLGVDNAYTVMLYRLADSQRSKVLTERVVHEGYAAMDSLLQSSLTYTLRPPILTLASSRAFAMQANLSFLIILTFFVTFLYS